MNTKVVEKNNTIATEAADNSVKTVEVLTKKDLWKWVRFPNELYKGNKFFVPFLENDEFDLFSSSIDNTFTSTF